MTRRVPRGAVHSPDWLAVYTHPENPNVEVTVRSNEEPQDTRMFLVAGGPTLLHITRKERVNENTTNKESTTDMATQTRKRPKKSGTRRARPAPEPEVVEDDDLDGLDVDDLDVDDLDDLDIEDEEDIDIEDDAEEDDSDDLDEDEDDEEDSDDFDDLDEEDDEEEIEDEEDEDEIEEPEDEADDDFDDLDDLDEDEPEPEPAPRKRTAAKKSAAKAPPKAQAKSGERPLTDAQSKMLKGAVKNKTGAKVTNIGQQRTADSLVGRKLVKWASTDPKGGVVIGTAKGAKEIGADGVAYVAPEPKAEAPAKKSSGAKKSTGSKAKGSARQQRRRAASSGNGLPKGMFGVAAIAKKLTCHEETVRRVLRLNEDRWQPVDGRWQFTKDEAKEVIREVRSYIKYTGGTRGRPKGATTQLPDGKVGPSTIAEMAGVHRNTVYNFLHKHAERFERFKNDDGLYLFTEGQAQKLANKIAG